MSYVFEYDGIPSEPFEWNYETRPRWVKVVTDAEGVVNRTILNYDNKEEVENLTTSEVYTHLDNLVQYMKDVTSLISPIGLDEFIPKTGWHFIGNWAEVEWAKDESYKWWYGVYYKNEDDAELETAPPTEPEIV